MLGKKNIFSKKVVIFSEMCLPAICLCSGDPGGSGKCCPHKRVGGVTYTLEENDQLPVNMESCIDKCAYRYTVWPLAGQIKSM